MTRPSIFKSTDERVAKAPQAARAYSSMEDVANDVNWIILDPKGFCEAHGLNTERMEAEGIFEMISYTPVVEFVDGAAGKRELVMSPDEVLGTYDHEVHGPCVRHQIRYFPSVIRRRWASMQAGGLANSKRALFESVVTAIVAKARELREANYGSDWRLVGVAATLGSVPLVMKHDNGSTKSDPHAQFLANSSRVFQAALDANAGRRGPVIAGSAGKDEVVVHTDQFKVSMVFCEVRGVMPTVSTGDEATAAWVSRQCSLHTAPNYVGRDRMNARPVLAETWRLYTEALGEDERKRVLALAERQENRHGRLRARKDKARKDELEDQRKDAP